MTMPYIDQLKSQRETLSAFLQAQNNSPMHGSVGVRITIRIYTHILEDAIKTLNSLIQYLDAQT